MKKASPADPASAAAPSSRPIWLWIGTCVFFLAMLWTAMFTAARIAAIESVPLQTKTGGTP